MTSTTFPPAPGLDRDARDAASHRWATRAKPPGALGRIESLAVHLAGVTGQCPPPVPVQPAVVVFAGDHGVVEDGASAWPSEITAAMVYTISGGGAAINSFARMIGANVTVVDVGVQSPLGPLPNVRSERIREGTNSIARGPAMTVSEAEKAVNVGANTAADLIANGSDCLIGGEMGIGNTTPSAAIISAVTGQHADVLTGHGAGTPADGIEHKQKIIADAVERANAECDTPLEQLAYLGGFEIAALAGLYMAAAQNRTPYIVDGVIACAALCMADALAPGTAAHAIAGHQSTEPAAAIALDHLGLQPLLDLDLRLGEGTGACLAFPLVQAATLALANMADLPEAG